MPTFAVRSLGVYSQKMSYSFPKIAVLRKNDQILG